MELTYRRDPDHNYMIPDLQIPREEGYILQMLEDNRIPGFLPVSVQRMNGEALICYDITSRQPMTTIFERKGMTGRDIAGILRSLITACSNVRAYLMNPADILFLPDCIYLDPELREPMLCYLPGYRHTQERLYDELAEFILRHLDHADKRAVELGYAFYEQSHQDNFSFTAAAKRLLEDTDDQKDAVVQAEGPKEERTKEEKRQESRQDRQNAGQIQMAEPQLYAGEPEDVFRIEDKVLLEEEQEIYTERQGEGRRKTKRKTGSKKEIRKESRVKAAKTGRRKRSPEEKRRRLLWITGMLAAAVVFLLICWLFVLDLTQIGGLTFLFISLGWLIYGTVTGKEEKNKNHWKQELTEMEDEDAFMEQLMHEVYAPLREEENERVSSAEHTDYGQTRVLTMGVDVPEVTLVSENMAYPSLKPLLPQSLIGKQAEEVDLVLPRHAAASRIHAKLECTSEGIYLTDMNSTNGTYVNGAQIRSRTALRDGDQISFAGVTYRVRYKASSD